MLLFMLAGFIGVSNMILWGIYGDLMVEKFYKRKVLRSIILGLGWAGVLYLIDPSTPLFLVALIAIALERCSTEIYKALYRIEGQSKYLIPSDPFRKLPVWIKRTSAIILILALAWLLYSDPISAMPHLLIAIVTGMIVAVGGMAKDAPHEGFEKLKFFRSPVVALAIYFLVSQLFPEVGGIYLLLAIAGGERIVSEFYKKILNGKVPGKFKSKSYNTRWKSVRKRLLPLYGISVVLLSSLIFM